MDLLLTLGLIAIVWLGWWLLGAPTSGTEFLLTIGVSLYWSHSAVKNHITQVRHGEMLKAIGTLERRLLLALGKYEDIPRMEWNLEVEKMHRQKQNEEAIQKMDRDLEQRPRKHEGERN